MNRMEDQESVNKLDVARIVNSNDTEQTPKRGQAFYKIPTELSGGSMKEYAFYGAIRY